MKIRDITLGALFLSISLIMFVIENQISLPAIVPGFKIGISNVVTLVMLRLWDKKKAFGVLILRIVISTIICANVTVLFYSLCGGVLSYFVMLLFNDMKSVPALSILGAVGHNTGQIFAAAFMLRGMSVFAYFPVLMALGCGAGLFTGLVAKFSIENKNIKALFQEGGK